MSSVEVEMKQKASDLYRVVRSVAMEERALRPDLIARGVLKRLLIPGDMINEIAEAAVAEDPYPVITRYREESLDRRIAAHKERGQVLQETEEP